MARACYKADAATFESKALSDRYFVSINLQKVLMLTEIAVIKATVVTQHILGKKQEILFGIKKLNVEMMKT